MLVTVSSIKMSSKHLKRSIIVLFIIPSILLELLSWQLKVAPLVGCNCHTSEVCVQQTNWRTFTGTCNQPSNVACSSNPPPPRMLSGEGGGGLAPATQALVQRWSSVAEDQAFYQKVLISQTWDVSFTMGRAALRGGFPAGASCPLQPMPG